MKTFLGWAMVLSLSLCVGPAKAGHVWWQDRDGAAGHYADATWADLQSAINLAQTGSEDSGMVKISGDIARTDGAWGQISVTNGGYMTISGGWNWPGGGAEPDVQDDRSTLDVAAVALGSNARVLHIGGQSDVTLDSLTITGGYRPPDPVDRGGGVWVDGTAHRFVMNSVIVSNNVVAGGWVYGGGGLGIVGSTDLTGLRISHSRFVGNQCGIGAGTGGGRGFGAALWLNRVGTSASPMVVEHTTIADNLVLSQYERFAAVYVGQAGSIEKAYVLFANCLIVDNRTVGDFASALLVAGDTETTVTIFGSLLAGNRHQDGVTPVPVIQATARTVGPGYGVFLVNSTAVANGTGGGIRTPGRNQWPILPQYAFNAVNSLIEGHQAWAGYSHHPNRGRTHHSFQNTTLSFGPAPGFVYVDFNGDDEVTETHYVNDFTAALAVIDSADERRFHSLTTDATPVRTQTFEANIEGTATFVGSGEHPYALAPVNPNAVGNALLRQGEGFTYVDVNFNGAYDSLTDIIVSGTPPTEGDHFVYTTDLAGNPRVSGGAIDRGAYQTPPAPPGGTVIRFQ